MQRCHHITTPRDCLKASLHCWGDAAYLEAQPRRAKDERMPHLVCWWEVDAGCGVQQPIESSWEAACGLASGLNNL